MVRKKWFVLGAAFLVTVSGTACGSIKEKAEVIKKLSAGEEVLSSVEKMKRADSLAAEIDVDMELSVFGKGFDTNTSVEMKYQSEPQLLYDEISVDMGLLGTQIYENYVKAEENTYLIYSKDRHGWTKSEQPKEDTAEYSMKEGLELYLNNVESLSKQESEEINGSKTEKYEGVLRGDAVYDIMKRLNIFDQIQDVSGTSFVVEDSMFLDLDDIPVELWIDHKSGYLVQGKMDMTDAAKKLFINVTEQMEGIAGSVANKIGIENLKLSIDCSNFNQLPEISIPQEAEQQGSEK